VEAELYKLLLTNLWDETIIIKNENLLLENGTKAPKFNGNLTEEKFFRDNKVSFIEINNAIQLHHHKI
jgi:diaminohydroxyphosphoribosylaminopyrimidine deaminase/5-amino-6-(5-phosphoribosylamino)uracil reductase